MLANEGVFDYPPTAKEFGDGGGCNSCRSVGHQYLRFHVVYQPRAYVPGVEAGRRHTKKVRKEVAEVRRKARASKKGRDRTVMNGAGVSVSGPCKQKIMP